MDKNSNNKALNFFKKEGFYVILFICLCIVATVASITASNNKKLSSNQAIQKEQANAGGILKEQQQEKEYQGALEVKKDDLTKTEGLKPVPNIQKVTTGNITAPVSKSLNATFTKPVAKGQLARAYSKDLVLYKTNGSYKINLGIDIKAKIGEPVLAANAGIVKAVGTDVDGQNGYMVIIDHGNGFTTKYSNLEKEILVKVNEKVNENQKIATVGNTSLYAYKEDYGSHLHFEVLQSSKADPTKYENVDPTRYVKYEKYQPVVTKQ